MKEHQTTALFLKGRVGCASIAGIPPNQWNKSMEQIDLDLI
ncbi:MAG: hypothetical protein AB8B50_07270 [Pirellulaceae bacterium]